MMVPGSTVKASGFRPIFFASMRENELSTPPERATPTLTPVSSHSERKLKAESLSRRILRGSSRTRVAMKDSLSSFTLSRANLTSILLTLTSVMASTWTLPAPSSSLNLPATHPPLPIIKDLSDLSGAVIRRSPVSSSRPHHRTLPLHHHGLYRPLSFL